MDELIVLTYLGGFASTLLFAVRERVSAPLITDFLVAGVVALWPLAVVLAVAAGVYRALPRRR